METMTLAEALSRKFIKPGKYGNVATPYNGRNFDSKHEANTAKELDMLRSAKNPKERVTDIKYQVPFVIQIKGKKICTYFADFVVTYADKHIDVIDAKGVLTDVYKLKKKLVKACYGIDIIEV